VASSAKLRAAACRRAYSALLDASFFLDAAELTEARDEVLAQARCTRIEAVRLEHQRERAG